MEQEELEFHPPVLLTAWLDLLLTRLSDAAAGDADLRRAVLRSGWASAKGALPVGLALPGRLTRASMPSRRRLE